MPAKKLPQTPLEMLEGKQARRTGSKLYREQSAVFVDSRIGGLVEQMGKELERVGKAEPVSLTDFDRVVEITLDYVRSCAQASTIPSIVGLSRALGHARQSIYDTIERNSPKEAARWFSLCRDGFAEALSNSALRNDTNTITSIFLLKALYDFKESVEVVARKESVGPLGPLQDPEELRRRILGTVVVDDFDD